MKRLHKFLLRTYLGPMFMTFFIVMFILLMQFLWRYIDDLVGKGLNFGVISELMLYASAGLIPMALPLATMLAILMTLGNMGEHNELLAMKSAGISLPRILYPLTVASLLITLLAYVISDYVVPVSTLKMRTIIYSVQQQRPDLVIRPGVFYNDIAGYSIRVGDRDRNERMMRDLMIYDHSQGQGNISVTRADSGFITVTPDQKFLIVELYSGTRYDETSDDGAVYMSSTRLRARTTTFQRERLIKRLEGFGFERTDEGLFTNTHHVMNTRQLSRAYDSVGLTNDSLIQAEYKHLANGLLLLPTATDSMYRNLIRDTFHFNNYYAAADNAKKKEILTETIASAQTLKSHVMSYVDDLKYAREKQVRYIVEYYRKYSMALAVLIFFLIGAPLGAIIRKGGLGLPVIISVLFFIVYYVISITSEKVVRQLLVAPEIGMWSASVVLILLASFLLYKATTDSVIMNREGYRGIGRFFAKLHKKALKLLH